MTVLIQDSGGVSRCDCLKKRLQRNRHPKRNRMSVHLEDNGDTRLVSRG